MSKEWYESKEWNASATDYEMPTEDTTSTDYEISVPKLECAFATEYYDEDISKTEDTQESTTNKSHKKRMRKMLYGIASMIMVVSMGSAITSTEPIGILSEQKVLFDVYNRETHYAKSGIITVGGAYSIWGGGHISGELRRVNYKGEAIEVEDRNSEGFLGKWINNDGYMLAQRPSRYALYDKNGNFLYEWQDDGFSRIHIAEAAISNNNIVYIYRNVGSVTERKLRFSYYTVYGKELCSIETDVKVSQGHFANYGTPFRDGVALCNDDTGILLIQENGDIERLVDWAVVDEEENIRYRFGVGEDGTIEDSDGRYVLENVPCVVSGNVSQGYFCVTDAVGNMALVNVETGEMYKTKIYYCMTDVEHINDWKYVMYTDNEGEMIHYGTLMCSVEKNENKERKYYLFDVAKHCDEDGKRTGYLACYDAIYFENYQYLVARDGTDYFYIDLDGNRVSENYKKASTFNDYGYALVQTQAGDFYVINDEFQKLEQVRGIDDFTIKDIGEVFWVTCGEEPHSYYYGPDIYNNR